MNILSRYFSPFFFAALLGTLATCATLLLIAKLTNVLDDLLVYRGPREIIVKYILAQLPGFLHFSLPLTGFMTGALCAARFRQTHEFTAVWASGNSLRSVLKPVIVALWVSVPAVLVFQDSLLPFANKTAADRYRELTGPSERETAAETGPLNLHLPEISFHSPAFDFKTQSTRHLILKQKLADGSHVNHVCKGFDRRDETVKLHHCKIYTIGADFTTGSYSEQASVNVRHKALAEALAFQPHAADESDFSTLSSALRYNTLRGLTNHTVWTEIFSRIAYALVLPLAACFGFFAGLRLTGGGLALVLGVSLVFAALYYTVLFTLRALGNNGAMHPTLAAFLPNASLAVLVWISSRRFGF